MLRENELLITEWAPVHLNTMLKTWFWKNGTQDVSAMETWQKTCQYLYLPRLKDDMVFAPPLLPVQIAASSSAWPRRRMETSTSASRLDGAR